MWSMITIMTNCCIWLSSSPPASQAALWALQHCVQLWTDVGPGCRPADRPLSLHLADEQCAHAGLWARRGPADHAESRLAHQRPPSAAEAPVLLRPGQRHRLRCVGAATKHEEGWEGHCVQHAAAGGGELPSCTYLRHHGGQDELLWHGLQEGDRERQVSHLFATASLRFTADLQFFLSDNFTTQHFDIHFPRCRYNIDFIDADGLLNALCFPHLKSLLSWGFIKASYLTFSLKRLYMALEAIL